MSGAGGAATEFSLSDAFGNPFLTSDFGGATTTARPFGFVGAEGYHQDAESGLMLLGNRFYDPSIGRFLSSDPAEDGSNWYAYVENSPTGFTDPEGLDIGSGRLDIPYSKPKPTKPSPPVIPIIVIGAGGLSGGLTVPSIPVIIIPVIGGVLTPPPTPPQRPRSHIAGDGEVSIDHHHGTNDH